MMRKLSCLILFALLCAPLACGQGVEVFGGYSYNRLDKFNGGFRTDLNTNGFDAAVTFYPTQRFGVTGDVSGHYKNEDVTITCPPLAECLLPPQNIRSRFQLYNFLAGAQYKLRGSNRVQPFAHALFGVANTRARVETRLITNGQLTSSYRTTRNDFAMALGGGVDVRLNDRFDLRAIQADYNPVFYRGTLTTFNSTSVRSDNVRLSFGIVIK